MFLTDVMSMVADNDVYKHKGAYICESLLQPFFWLQINI